MYGKVLLFCLLTFVATQCHPQNVDFPETRISWEEIKELIKQIGTMINEIKEKILWKLNEIIKTIKNTITHLDINEIIEQIKEAIASAVGEGSHVEECIEDETDTIKNLAQTYIDDTKKCGSDAMSQVTSIQNQANDLIEEAEELISYASSEGLGCVTNKHPLDCFTNLLGEIKTKFSVLKDDTTKLIGEATKLIPDISVGLTKCTAGVAKEMQEGTQKIIADIIECAAT